MQVFYQFPGLYISVITGVVTASIICTILISQIHHRGEIEIPHLVRRLTFDCLASALCLPVLKKSHGTKTHLHPKVQPNAWSSGMCQSNSIVRLRLVNGGHSRGHRGDAEQNNSNCEKKISATRDEEKGLLSENGETTSVASKSSLSAIDTHLQQIIEALSEYENRRIESTTAEFRVMEWKAVAKVFDRLFFIVFLAAMLVITVFFLTHRKDEPDFTIKTDSIPTGRPTPTI